MKPLFIAGPGRSGSTALTMYLNEHPEVLVCRERFKWIPREEVKLELFTFERIMDFEDGYERRDSGTRKKRHQAILVSKDFSKLRWVGDKVPGYTQTLPLLAQNNPGARFLLTYRPVEEVAESTEARSKNPDDFWLGGKDGFKVGIQHWNRALRRMRDFLESEAGKNALVVSYHDFFYRNEEFIPTISRFLDIEFGETVRRAWREATRDFESTRRPKVPLNKRHRRLIEKHADREAEAYILSRIEMQREGTRP